jgi:hypothetical protein
LSAYKLHHRVWDAAGKEQQAPASFEYGQSPLVYNFKANGTFYYEQSNGFVLPGKWKSNGNKILLERTEEEYSFSDNNNVLTLIAADDEVRGGIKYHNNHYMVFKRVEL